MEKIICETKILIDKDIEWGEGPRWHDGFLYFSDIMGNKIMKTDLVGHAEKVVDVPGMPSGTGFLPDGKLLVVSGVDGRLYTDENGALADRTNAA